MSTKLTIKERNEFINRIKKTGQTLEGFKSLSNFDVTKLYYYTRLNTASKEEQKLLKNIELVFKENNVEY